MSIKQEILPNASILEIYGYYYIRLAYVVEPHSLQKSKFRRKKWMVLYFGVLEVEGMKI